jgi:hypothetical protein
MVDNISSSEYTGTEIQILVDYQEAEINTVILMLLSKD